jgi:hypothetical protein
MYTSTSTWDQRVTADIAVLRLNFRDGGAAPRLWKANGEMALMLNMETFQLRICSILVKNQ